MDAVVITTILGGISGYFALGWHIINKIIKYINKPRLKIELDTIYKSKLWRDRSGKNVSRFSSLIVRNEGSGVALNCQALLRVVEASNEGIRLDEKHGLHWADYPPSTRTSEPELVEIRAEPRRLDVAFVPYRPSREREDIGLSNSAIRTANFTRLSQTSEQPNVSGSVPPDIFLESNSPITQSQETTSEPSAGAWIATPAALSAPIQPHQDYLPPGNYKVEIEVRCDNGEGDKKRFAITSPINADDLDINLA